MNRRDAVIALLPVGAAPLGASAQQAAKKPTLGLLALASGTMNNEFWDRTLKGLGWAEGQNISIKRANAEGRLDRLAALAADLVLDPVDVIFTFGPEASIAAARATKTIPIVFLGPAFPVEQGLVDSYARPGRNVTGVAWNSAYVKQLEFVKQIAPRATRVAHFHLPTSLLKVDGGDYRGLLPQVEATGKKMGLEVRPFRVAAPGDFDGALREIKKWQAQALIVYTTPLTALARKQIIDFTASNRIPTFCDWRGFAESGALFSYGPLTSEMTVQSVGLLDRVLRGARTADLPVELPKRFEFVINRKTADALGLQIPQELLLRADEAIG